MSVRFYEAGAMGREAISRHILLILSNIGGVPREVPLRHSNCTLVVSGAPIATDELIAHYIEGEMREVQGETMGLFGLALIGVELFAGAAGAGAEGAARATADVCKHVVAVDVLCRCCPPPGSRTDGRGAVHQRRWPSQRALCDALPHALLLTIKLQMCRPPCGQLRSSGVQPFLPL